jgi:hypothetical protein
MKLGRHGIDHNEGVTDLADDPIVSGRIGRIGAAIPGNGVKVSSDGSEIEFYFEGLRDDPKIRCNYGYRCSLSGPELALLVRTAVASLDDSPATQAQAEAMAAYIKRALQGNY